MVAPIVSTVSRDVNSIPSDLLSLIMTCISTGRSNSFSVEKTQKA